MLHSGVSVPSFYARQREMARVGWR